MADTTPSQDLTDAITSSSGAYFGHRGHLQRTAESERLFADAFTLGADFALDAPMPTTPTPTQQAAAVPEALRSHDLATVVAFLLGEASLDGVEFSERHPTERGAYWWRKHLRAAIRAAAPAVASPELQRMTAHRAVFFLERFLREEKLLGPNEQAAVRFAVAALEVPQAEQPGAAAFLESPDVQDESGINTHYSRALVLECIDAALGSRTPAAAPMSAQPSDRAVLAKKIKDCAAHWAYVASIDHEDQAEVEEARHAELVDALVAAAAPTTEQAGAPSDAMVDAYLSEQRRVVEEADRFGRPNVGGLHTNTVREACRAGIAAAMAAQGQKGAAG